MAKNFRIEHVATTPRGWHVRTVTQGDHEVRIAFPPGRRLTGSGHVVEVLHPKHENPNYCPSKTRRMNPAELVLMGANPTIPEKHQKKVQQMIKKMPKPVREVFDRNPHGRRYAIKWHTGNISQAFGTEREAKQMLERFHGAGEIIRVNPMPLRHRNPIDSALEQAEARDIHEGFVSDRTREYWDASEPHMPSGNYAYLGRGGFVSDGSMRFPAYVAVKSEKSGTVLQIELGSRIVFLSSADRLQLWLAGVISLSDSEISRFTDSRMDVVELGECRAVGYIAKKYHREVGNDAAGRNVLWEHPFESPKPHVWYSRKHERLILRGGGYRVEDAGIVG